MLILNAQDTRKALPMGATIEAMKRAYTALSTGKADIPVRSALRVPAHGATALFMPAYVSGDETALTLKVVTLFPENVPAGLPLIHAAVLVMDSDTGAMQAMIEGSMLTAIRTGAGAGAATDVLARPDSHVLALIGTGVQARTQLEAICAVRDIETVWVYSPTPQHVHTFIHEMQGQPNLPTDMRAAHDPSTAIRSADIICAATTATAPVFDPNDVRPGTHINGVGSYTPAMIEIPPELAQTALVVVDNRDAAQAEAGELLAAEQNGAFRIHDTAEIGEVLARTRVGRTSVDQITFFKSVGVAVQDALAAQLALTNADMLALGQRVSW